MSGQTEKIQLAVVFGFGVAFGVFLRRWKGDAIRSNVCSQHLIQIGTAIGYFLVADHKDEHTEPE